MWLVEKYAGNSILLGQFTENKLCWLSTKWKRNEKVDILVLATKKKVKVD